MEFSFNRQLWPDLIEDMRIICPVKQSRDSSCFWARDITDWQFTPTDMLQGRNTGLQTCSLPQAGFTRSHENVKVSFLTFLKVKAFIKVTRQRHNRSCMFSHSGCHFVFQMEKYSHCQELSEHLIFLNIWDIGISTKASFLLILLSFAFHLSWSSEANRLVVILKR